MKVLLALLLVTSFADAQEIEEAQGLEDSPTVESRSETPASKNFSSRAYLFLEGLTQKSSTTSVNQIPNSEASLSANYKTSQGLTYFIDGLWRYYDNTKKGQGILNQGGIRYQASDSFNFALGKERNRRSPGIIVSPSDLLLSQTFLPGVREDRRGVWSARASYQSSKSSYDIFALPVNTMDDAGLPTSSSRYQGTVVRTFQQFGGWDLSLSLGQLNAINQAGLAVQGIVADVWKTYYELGYSERYTNTLNTESRDVTQHLLGVSFEGIDNFNFKFEYFYNGQGLSFQEFDSFKMVALLSSASASSAGSFTSAPFLRKQYGIFTVSSLEIKNCFNVFSSLAKSLEDSSSLVMARGEYLINDHLVVGTMALLLNGDSTTQYFLRSFDQQYSLDLKYTF